MMHQPSDRWHRPGCDCPKCAPCPLPGLTRLDRISLQIIGGLGFGLLLAFIIDRLLGAPVFGR